MAERAARSIVLASGSAARRALLEGAGVAFTVRAADVDEVALRQELARRGISSPEQVAAHLARAKAETVSRALPAALVIGADQVLDFEGEVLAKAESAAAARDSLRQLRGKRHALHSAVVIAEGGVTRWETIETARLDMRAFSDGFLEDYVRLAGPALTASVGAYQLEGPGIQLFEAIEGDYFTILGLPLLPLLAKLRGMGALST
ncbi:MAG: Maf family protein [Hyphomicrobiaceae bacterium]